LCLLVLSFVAAKDWDESKSSIGDMDTSTMQYWVCGLSQKLFDCSNIHKVLSECSHFRTSFQGHDLQDVLTSSCHYTCINPKMENSWWFESLFNLLQQPNLMLQFTHDAFWHPKQAQSLFEHQRSWYLQQAPPALAQMQVSSCVLIWP